MNTLPRRKVLACCISLAFASMALQQAHADSGYGVDTAVGNAFNTGYVGGVRDTDATAGHTPTGQMFNQPYATEEAVAGETHGYVEIGVLSKQADNEDAMFRAYKDPKSGLYLNSFGVDSESDNARFVTVNGGGVGNNDQFYNLTVGRYNDWKVKAFYSETPHVFTTTYRNLWSGTGTGNQTLKSLTPGGTTNAATTDTNIEAAALATPYSELSIVRKKGGVRGDLKVTNNISVFAGYSNEKRTGARPFGLVMGGGGGTGGVEIPESIDYNTHDFLAGMNYADEVNSANLTVAASLFRNNIDTMKVENPMFLAAANGIASFPHAIYDLYPNNDYLNVKGEYARELPELMKGRFTGVVSVSQSKQNDNLIPSTSYSGAAVNGVAGGSWDTVDSLSQPTANLKVDIKLADFGLSLKPLDDLDVKGKVRYYETKTNSDYWACNPLTGQWGRLINDGSGNAIMVGSATAANNQPTYADAAAANLAINAAACDASAVQALGIVAAAGNNNIHSAPYAYKQMNYTLGADYRIDSGNSVNANIERETMQRQHRERDKTREDKLKLGYVNRGMEDGTLRLSFETDKLRGSAYNPDPYDEFYSASLSALPFATGTNVSSWIHINALHRKFDLADRDQNILNLRFNYMITPDLDAGVAVQLKDIKFPDAAYGRGSQNQNSVNFDMAWQPSPEMTVSGYYAYQTGKMEQQGLQQNACVIGTTYNFWSDGSISTVAQTAAQLAAGVTLVNSTTVTAGNFLSGCGTASATSSLYPTSRSYTINQKDQNNTVGLGFKFDFDNKNALDANYTHTNGRTATSYTYNPYALGLYTSGAPTAAQLTNVGLIGNGFADQTFSLNTLDASLLVPLTKQSSVRLLGHLVFGDIHDWHYDGVEDLPNPNTNQQTYLDSGPQNFRAYVFGVMYQLKM
ncbi:MAG: MtrB/PioB family outer membrane beta-barrel protein [Gammaproteobacteria bacterium]|nr:MtrB/PioB family outer membrane beta-barrel protein [Gammaproteobacteria bacterium]MBU1775511.1 MtrB/PioB family outer membrane beta-barrel protein [Gammaproteobacteria bacterium]MBU1968874.1 MtrB/PioB family outer membrane beta-barrel protein [Gammaproteobacteria bacterium]